MATVVKYWPAIGAAVYLVYALGWNQAQLPAAITALVTTLGVNQGVVSAHAQIRSLKS
jgi:hypothetical protein